ncbi:MAG: hypothetical protein L0Y72_21155 [Gemmataceae bacterium]|nr:hypothetical protein [Gemmataceae bacterium]MCI0741551.1 hypothetical protein [Gemmataceae bacterium]
MSRIRWTAALSLLGSLCLLSMAASQDSVAPVKVVIADGKTVAQEPTLPLDPTPRITPGYAGGLYFGLSCEGKRICCSPQGSIWSTMRVDGQEIQPGGGPGDVANQPPQQLPPGPFGKKRLGSIITWTASGIHVTQTIELVPSKILGKAEPGQKRKLDTARITYLVENKHAKPISLEWRVGIDIMVNNNDGALFASPTTEPGKILNGVELKGDKLPEYIQVLERPNFQDPGFVAHMTVKHGKTSKAEGPSRVILTNLGAFGGGWDIPAVQAGDAACAIYWAPKTIRPGEKRELVWAYGGGVASNPENEGRVTVALGGSFEPGKLFTISAFVDDPVPGQSLELELPPGFTRIEGREIQPVPPPSNTGTSMVLWKARVERMGDYELKIRSSTGVTQSKNISIQPAAN